MKFYGVTVISRFLMLAVLSCIFLLSCQSKPSFTGNWDYQDSGTIEGTDSSWYVESPLSGFRFSISEKQIIARSTTGTRTNDYKLVGDNLLIVEGNPQVIDSITIVSLDDQSLVLKMNTYPSLLRFKRDQE